MLDYLKYRVLTRRATNRLRYGILRAKQLEELKLKEQTTTFIRHKERYAKRYNKAAIRQYFIKERPYILIEMY